MVCTLKEKLENKYPGNFLKAIIKTLKYEGGYINHPLDRGGETKYGISKKSFPNLNIKNLSKEDAIEIYYTRYWKNYDYYLIDRSQIREKIFDMSILMGHKKAIEILQSALNRLGTKLKEDGILGELTAKAINKNPHVYEKYIESLENYFNQIVKNNPSQKVFLNGWINRVRS